MKMKQEFIPDTQKQNKSKNSKAWSDFLVALLSTVLCVGLLAGATFAWYSSTLTTPAQVIQTGNMSAKLSYLTGYDGGGNPVWADATASGAKLFGDQLLHPNQTATAVLKVENTGDIDLTYSLSPVYTGTAGTTTDNQQLSSLVYMGVQKVSDSDIVGACATLHNALAAGNQNQLLSVYDKTSYQGTAASGTLAKTDSGTPGGCDIYVVGLFVPENVNLSYTGETKPSCTVQIQLRAAQAIDTSAYAPMPWDGETYKKLDFIPRTEGNYPGCCVFNVSTADELAYILKNVYSWGDANYVVVLSSSIDMNNKPLNYTAITKEGVSMQITAKSGVKVYNLKLDVANVPETPDEANPLGNKVTVSNVTFMGTSYVKK